MLRKMDTSQSRTKPSSSLRDYAILGFEKEGG
jgi:hypothetical protein